jgi:hypothetical protein
MKRLAFAIVLLGCRGKDKREEPAPAPKAAAPLDAAIAAKPAADAAPIATSTTVVCDRLMPPALLAVHYPDMTLKESFAPDYPGVLCELAGTAKFGNAGFLCSDASGFAAMMDFSRGQLKDVKDLAVGKRAFVGTISGISTLGVWDEDAACIATINGFTGDPMAFATALEQALTAEVGDLLRARALAPPSAPIDAGIVAGKPDVCDRLLPADVRAAQFPGLPMTEMIGMGGVSCTLGDNSAHVQAYCPVDTPDSKKYTVDLARTNMENVVEIAGNPDAFKGRAMGTTILFVWDDDARCGVTAHSNAGDDGAFATALQGAFTAEIGDRLRATLPK